MMALLRIPRILSSALTVLLTVIGLAAAINALVRTSNQVKSIGEYWQPDSNPASFTNLLVPTVLLLFGEFVLGGATLYSLSNLIINKKEHPSKKLPGNFIFNWFYGLVWLYTFANAAAMNVIGGSKGIKISSSVDWRPQEMGIADTYWGNWFIILLMISPWPLLGSALLTIIFDQIGHEMERIVAVLGARTAGEFNLRTLRDSMHDVQVAHEADEDALPTKGAMA